MNEQDVDDYQQAFQSFALNRLHAQQPAEQVDEAARRLLLALHLLSHVGRTSDIVSSVNADWHPTSFEHRCTWHSKQPQATNIEFRDKGLYFVSGMHEQDVDDCKRSNYVPRTAYRQGARVSRHEGTTKPHGDYLLLALHRLEDLETAHQGLIDRHHRTCVVELPAVVGGAEDRDKLALGKELVAVLNDLVSAADEIHVHLREEAGHDIRTEDEGH
eukprot:CAMPEP_0177181858 /NCGR_PEP_ID=MMETSP0367-20130122/16157_1 /TAXON_ID=447022 ORGANISM="Scrippsiella hangoei-like, Strain SHHI-4" /NCGR_SAMPLE_ID=MMETSP0367 /ASSEMBLY_ACC=CAM_ASM_000362 /LENGTH=215 /DNA_ID=CAMNT_0018628753 /DNA_START=90 /DNA_END=736 /DNA_ORIENTATION=+